jgi:hypothetical protein
MNIEMVSASVRGETRRGQQEGSSNEMNIADNDKK